MRLSQNNCPAPSRSQLNASLLWQNQSLPLTALIDSVADESFLDGNVVDQLALNTVQLDLPLVPVVLSTSGNHQEKISFHVTDCADNPWSMVIPGWFFITHP